jgi:hypothetical protein
MYTCAYVYIYAICTSRWYVRNYVRIYVYVYIFIVCQGGDHSKKVTLSLRIVVVLYGIVNVVLANPFQDPEGH